MKIFIAGDVVPHHRTMPLFQQKKTEELFDGILPFIRDADISIVNLEAPIITGALSPIKKHGPALHTTMEALETLIASGFNTVAQPYTPPMLWEQAMLVEEGHWKKPGESAIRSAEASR